MFFTEKFTRKIPGRPVQISDFAPLRQQDPIDCEIAQRRLMVVGYSFQIKSGRVIVQDPERSSIKGLVYREVTLRTNGDLRRFFSERS